MEDVGVGVLGRVGRLVGQSRRPVVDPDRLHDHVVALLQVCEGAPPRPGGKPHA